MSFRRAAKSSCAVWWKPFEPRTTWLWTGPLSHCAQPTEAIQDCAAILQLPHVRLRKCSMLEAMPVAHAKRRGETIARVGRRTGGTATLITRACMVVAVQKVDIPLQFTGSVLAQSPPRTDRSVCSTQVRLLCLENLEFPTGLQGGDDELWIGLQDWFPPMGRCG